MKRNTKLRILAASDLHGDSSLAKRLASKAEREKVDLVVLCGDLTQSEQSTQGIIGPFIKKDQKVVLIPGNHESVATADFLAELYDATNLHGYSIKVNDVGFFGCSGTNSGIHQLKDKEVYELLKKGYKYIEGTRKKVMVTHVHPSNTKIEKFSNFVHGSEGVSKAVKGLKPDILLCGHVHEASGIEEKVGKTRIINVGRTGSIIEI
ncbi:MAG: metallophosphoesterase family protein [Nanoarchaeota archaeon]|nr:metallophosphoesterase family protein [Nanoarchaeota archaeon]